MFPGYLTRNPEFGATPVSGGATPVATDNAPPEVPEFLTNPTQEVVDTELAAHSLSVVEIVRNGDDQWEVVLAKARLAADLLGATRMDRPEDFETNPVTGKVYLVCTNNSNRTLDETDDANPRPNTFAGHIIEIMEDANDHAATTFGWEIFILAGDPEDSGTWYGDAECTGPVFTPDNSALVVAVQHPGEASSLDEPLSLWPDRRRDRPGVNGDADSTRVPARGPRHRGPLARLATSGHGGHGPGMRATRAISPLHALTRAPVEMTRWWERSRAFR